MPRSVTLTVFASIILSVSVLSYSPATGHLGTMARHEWLAPMVAEFLGVPLTEEP